MKKIRLFTIAVFILGFVSTSFADGDKGIRAGYQMSNLYYDGSGMNDPFNSFFVGITKDMKIVPMVHIGSGIEYSQIGTFTDNDNKITMHYISVPIHAKLKIGPVYGLAGLAANIKVGEKWKVKGADVDPITKANSFDIPVFAGVGLKFLMLSVEVRYHWGTMALYDSPSDPYKTQYIQVGLGVSF